MRLLRVLLPVPEGSMANMQMTPDEEYGFYARPENQQPQGPPRRRRSG
jgi:hypothetical protein